MDDIINEIKNTREIKLPVKFINDIKVDVILKFHNGFFEILIVNTLLKKCPCTWNFHIMYFKQMKSDLDIDELAYPPDLDEMSSSSPVNVSVVSEQIMKCFENTKEVLKSLEIDTKSKFPHFIDDKNKIMNKYFSEFSQRSQNEEPCCVCYEPTFQKTRCNHALCIKCRFTILSSKQTKCPICRDEYLFYIKKCSNCIDLYP